MMMMMSPPSFEDVGLEWWSDFGPESLLRAVNVSFYLEVKNSVCHGFMWQNCVPMLCILVLAFYYFAFI
jgi:hypothetical protein